MKIQQPTYPQGSLLVEPEWLAEHCADKNLRIVDMRSEKAYAAGHIPGAIRIEDKPLRNPEERFTYLPRPEVFTELMNRAGIGNQTDVVIYDDEGGKLAARLWYLLHAFGHSRSKLLNGGWQKWIAQIRRVSTEATVVPSARYGVTLVFRAKHTLRTANPVAPTHEDALRTQQRIFYPC